ncbi:c-type cytochrome biogenesis protein CcmI [Noviherbaspirillum sp. ST9]|uniref:c-type cytochrome biogenesis protein CcmI n=1 Tax=Noviherbaspirillum sp. ST9 TaxID=3401606 RepID=UPI003B589AF1
MTVFLIGAGLLVAAALAFLLPPLLRKEQAAGHVQRDQLNLAVLRDQLRELEADREAGLIEQAAYESARHELERRVAEEVRPQEAAPAVDGGKRWAAGAVGVAVPVIAISTYLLVGSPEAMDPAQQVASAHQQNSHEVTAEQIEGMVATLAERLKNEPDNIEGWHMLARSYNAIGRFKEAADAYARLVQLVPNDSNLLSDYADTLAMALGRTLVGEPEKLAAKAVQIDPQNVKAIALWGSAAFERKDYAAAVERWQKIMALVPADSEVARSVSGSIAEAQKLGGMAPVAQAKPEAPKAAASGAKVTGTVDIDPALRAQVADTDTVFIFARAAEGPRFPLAVLRKQVKDLPASFELNDSMSMMPEAKLSSVPMVVVGARVSKNGSATPAPGDLEGVTAPVAPGAANLKITINRKNG